MTAKKKPKATIAKTLQLAPEQVRRGERAARKVGVTFHAFGVRAFVEKTEAVLAGEPPLSCGCASHSCASVDLDVVREGLTEGDYNEEAAA